MQVEEAVQLRKTGRIAAPAQPSPQHDAKQDTHPPNTPMHGHHHACKLSFASDLTCPPACMGVNTHTCMQAQPCFCQCSCPHCTTKPSLPPRLLCLPCSFARFDAGSSDCSSAGGAGAGAEGNPAGASSCRSSFPSRKSKSFCKVATQCFWVQQHQLPQWEPTMQLSWYHARTKGNLCCLHACCHAWPLPWRWQIACCMVTCLSVCERDRATLGCAGLLDVFCEC